MLKNRLTNFLLIILVIGVIGTNVTLYKATNHKNEEIKKEQTQKEKVNEEIAVENQRKLDEQILREKIDKSNRFVKNISNQTEIILLCENGKFEIRHDRTPENNKFKEWLINAELTMKLDYHTIFSIKSKDIKFDITEDGSVITTYDTSKIVIRAIEISNVTLVQKASVFGTKYKPTEVAALEKIAKEKIFEQTYNDENISKASENLKIFINDLAQKFGVENISIVANNEDIYVNANETVNANNNTSSNIDDSINK